MAKKAVSELRKRIRSALNQKPLNVHSLVANLSESASPDTLLKEVKKELKSQKSRTNKALLRLALARTHFHNVEFDESIAEASNVAQDERLPDFIRAYAYSTTAYVCTRQNRLGRAERFGKMALSLVGEGTDDILADVLRNVGTIHAFRERYHLAFEYYDASAKAAMRIGDSVQAAAAMNNAGLALGSLGRDADMLKSLLEARRLSEESGDSLRLGFTFSILGDYYYDHADYEESIQQYNQALPLYESRGYKIQYAECHTGLARACLGLGRTEDALGHAQKALSLAEQFGQEIMLPLTYATLGAIHARLKNPDAEEYFKKSLEITATLEQGGVSGDMEFCLLEYGKFLLRGRKTEAADHIQKAYNILVKEPKSALVKRMLNEARHLLSSIGSAPLPSQEVEIQELKQGKDDLEKILDISKAINAETEMDKVLGLIIDAALEISGAERGLIVLFENAHWNFACLWNFPENIRKEKDYPAIQEIIRKVQADGKLLVEGNVRHSTAFKDNIPTMPQTVKAIFAFPLVIGDHVIGCVYLDSRFVVMDLSAGRRNLMTTLMEQAAFVIGKTGLYEQLRRLSEKLGEQVEHQKVELRRKDLELEAKQKELESRYSYENIIGKGPEMQKVFELLEKVAQSDLPVCIYGESGTGKELVAKAIHYSGSRRRKRFVAINCAAIPESLLESELFGYEKGAFTGAESRRKGLFEVASGGTLLLDEIGNMSESMQRKILRVAQENEVRRIGSGTEIRVDVRIISASNKDLRELVEAREFREDLYYRLNVLSLTLPPIRDRKEDISLLVEHFWQQAVGLPLDMPPEEKRELLGLLMDYDWPGNVRELENEVKRLVSLGGNRFDLKYLSKHILEGATKDKMARRVLTLPEMEKEFLLAALKKAKGNKAQAARILGIPRTSVKYKMDRFGIKLKDVIFE